MDVSRDIRTKAIRMKFQVDFNTFHANFNKMN